MYAHTMLHAAINIYCQALVTKWASKMCNAGEKKMMEYENNFIHLNAITLQSQEHKLGS